MARWGVGNPGNKGGGRKSLKDELVKVKALAKAWSKVGSAVDSEPVRDIALPLVLKDMATKVANPDGSSLIPTPVLVQFLNGKSTENNSDT